MTKIDIDFSTNIEEFEALIAPRKEVQWAECKDKDCIAVVFPIEANNPYCPVCLNQDFKIHHKIIRTLEVPYVIK